MTTKSPSMCICTLFSRPEFFTLYMHQLDKLTKNSKVDAIYILDETDIFDSKMKINGINFHVWKINRGYLSIGERRNTMIEWSKEDIIVFMDEDDIQSASRIRIQKEFLKKLDWCSQKDPHTFDTRTKEYFKSYCGVTASSLAMKRTCKYRFSDQDYNEENKFEGNYFIKEPYILLLTHKNENTNLTKRKKRNEEKIFPIRLDESELKYICLL